jgi:hypothetical protein
MSLRAPLLNMLLAAAAVFATPTRAVAEPPAFKDGEVIIKFKPNANHGDINAVRAALRATRLKHFRRIKADHERISGISVEQAITRFRGHRAIEYIEPNYIVHTTATNVIPNDPSFGELWGLRNTGQNGGRPGADISAVPAWDATTGSDILVAVIDTGVDYRGRAVATGVYYYRVIAGTFQASRRMILLK